MIASATYGSLSNNKTELLKLTVVYLGEKPDIVYLSRNDNINDLFVKHKKKPMNIIPEAVVSADKQEVFKSAFEDLEVCIRINGTNYTFDAKGINSLGLSIVDYLELNHKNTIKYVGYYLS